MRTNVEIDDQLIQQAMLGSDETTKRAVVEEALRLLVRTQRQVAIRRFRGKVQWEGNLEESRLNSDTSRG